MNKIRYIVTMEIWDKKSLAWRRKKWITFEETTKRFGKKALAKIFRGVAYATPKR